MLKFHTSLFEPAVINEATLLPVALRYRASDGGPTDSVAFIGELSFAESIGLIIKGDALKRIGEYLGNAPSFANLDEATAYIRAISATFGEHSEAQWRFLTEHVTKLGADSRVVMHYDPKIALPFRLAPAGDQALWPIFDAINCPVLVLRGEHSDLLARETFAEMQARGPKARGVTIPNVGHAPTLLTDAQIAPIREFLLTEIK